MNTLNGIKAMLTLTEKHFSQNPHVVDVVSRIVDGQIQANEAIWRRRFPSHWNDIKPEEYAPGAPIGSTAAVYAQGMSFY